MTDEMIEWAHAAVTAAEDKTVRDKVSRESERRSTEELVQMPVFTARGNLCCPSCGEYCGIETLENSIEVRTDHDDYEDDNQLRTRGGFVRIFMWCSLCGFHFNLTTGNHKGSQLMAACGGWPGELGRALLDRHEADLDEVEQ